MLTKRKVFRYSMSIVSSLVFFLGIANAQDFDNVKIQTINVADGVYMLMGAGGNIGISAGEDGVFMIDDQYAPLTKKIKGAISAISNKPIRFLINTHWHYDHTGGNENLGGAGYIIVAHENVRKRLSTEQFIAFFNAKVPPLAKSGLPVITFTGNVTFHLNGDEMYVFHVENAHTDGDAIIHFRRTNAVHMGDTFFSGIYPFIDTGSGGSINGVIKAVKQILSIVDEGTKVIPGHGPLSDRSDLIAYRDMLTKVRDRIRQQIDNGKTSDEVLAAKPTEEYDASWGKGFLKPEAFVKIVYQDLSRFKK